MSIPSPGQVNGKRRRENRLRRGFELTEPRHMIPVLIVAAVVATIFHLMAFRATPWLMRLWRQSIDVRQTEIVPDDSAARVVVRDATTELQEADTPPPTEDSLPPEQLEQDPQEIDLLDIDVQELVMAPGETNIALPEPTPTGEPETLEAQMMPNAPALSNTAPDLDSNLPALLPEPTPITANSVVINASPQLQDLDDAEGLIESELRRQASRGNASLPSDTRTLAQLMSIPNPGASSGVARLGSDLLFAFNESRLKNSARISLLQLAALIHKNPSTTFIIEGHTDSIGSEEYNAQLSLRRAQAVVSWLAGNGVPINRVFLRACGATHPLAPTNLPREEQALNRRVEIHMRKPGELLPEGCVPAKK